MSKAERTTIMQEFLQNEGYVPKLDSDGDITFKYEGGNYIIIFDDDDPEFFRLIYPAFWSIDSPEERVQVEGAALRATSQTKVAKVYLVGENTWAAIELFCPSAEAAVAVFPRSIRALRAAVNTFVADMRGEG